MHNMHCILCKAPGVPFVRKGQYNVLFDFNTHKNANPDSNPIFEFTNRQKNLNCNLSFNQLVDFVRQVLTFSTCGH